MEGNVESNQLLNQLKGKVIQVPLVDETLKKTGYAADAKVVGELLEALKKQLNGLDPYAGGTIPENVRIEKDDPYIDLVNTTTGRVGKVHNTDAENMVIANRTDDDNMVGLWVKPETAEPKDYFDLGTYINGVFKKYALFGEHTKTTGTYKGNGSATARTIDTKSVGSTVMINSGNGFAFVTPRGALCVSGTNVTSITSSAAKFVDGILTLASTENTLNKADGNYYWQVL